MRAKFVVAPVFENVKTDDLHNPLPPIQEVSPTDLRSIGFNFERPVCLKYVITENGRLILAHEWSGLIPLSADEIAFASGLENQSFFPNGDFIVRDSSTNIPMWRRVAVKHPEIAGLQKVLSAGDVYVLNGKIIAQHPSGRFGIDDWTGHYLVGGPHLKDLVETTFFANGYPDALHAYRSRVDINARSKMPILPRISYERIFVLPTVPTPMQITWQPGLRSGGALPAAAPPPPSAPLGNLGNLKTGRFNIRQPMLIQGQWVQGSGSFHYTIGPNEQMNVHSVHFERGGRVNPPPLRLTPTQFVARIGATGLAIWDVAATAQQFHEARPDLPWTTHINDATGAMLTRVSILRGAQLISSRSIPVIGALSLAGSLHASAPPVQDTIDAFLEMEQTPMVRLAVARMQMHVGTGEALGIAGQAINRWFDRINQGFRRARDYFNPPPAVRAIVPARANANINSEMVVPVGLAAMAGVQTALSMMSTREPWMSSSFTAPPSVVFMSPQTQNTLFAIPPLRGNWRALPNSADYSLPIDAHGNYLFVGEDGIAYKAADIKIPSLASECLKRGAPKISSETGLPVGVKPFTPPKPFQMPEWLKGVGIVGTGIHNWMAYATMSLSWATFGASVAVLAVFQTALSFFNKSKKHEYDRQKRNYERAVDQCDVIDNEVDEVCNATSSVVDAVNKYLAEEDPIRKEELRLEVEDLKQKTKELNQKYWSMNDNRLHNGLRMPSGSTHSHKARPETKDHIRKIRPAFEENNKTLDDCTARMEQQLPFDKLNNNIRSHSASSVAFGKLTEAYQKGEVTEEEFLKAAQAHNAKSVTLEKEMSELIKQHANDESVVKGLNTQLQEVQREIKDFPVYVQRNQLVRALIDADKSVDSAVTKAALEKFELVWEVFPEKTNFLILLKQQISIALKANEHEIVFRNAEKWIQLDNKDIDAVQLWINTALTLEKGNDLILEKINQLKPRFEDSYSIGILTYYQGFIADDLAIITESFNLLKGSSGTQVVAMLQNCLNRLESEDFEKRYVLSELAHPCLNDEFMLVDKRVDLLKVELLTLESEKKVLEELVIESENIKKNQENQEVAVLDKPVRDPEDIRQQADHTQQNITSLQKKIREHALRLRADVSAIQSQEARLSHQTYCFLHLGFDLVCATGVDQWLCKVCGAENPELDANGLRKIAGSAATLVVKRASDKATEAMKVDVDTILQKVGIAKDSAQGAELSNALEVAVQGNSNQLERFLNNYSNHLLAARLLEGIIEYSMQKLYQHDNPKKLSYGEWLKTKFWAWRMLSHTNTAMSISLDTANTIEMSNLLWLKGTAEKIDVTDVGISSLKLMLQAPIFARFLSVTLEPGKIASTNVARVYFDCYIKTMNASTIQKVTGTHGQILVKGMAWVCTYFAAHAAASTLLVYAVPGLQVAFVANSAYQLYQTVANTAPDKMKEIEIHNAVLNLQQDFYSVMFVLNEYKDDPAPLAVKKSFAKEIFCRIKMDIFRLYGSHPDLKELYIKVLFAQHYCAYEIFFIPLKHDGNGLFNAVAYYTKERASELRAAAATYIENNAEYFKDFIQGEIKDYVTELRRPNTPADALVIHALSAILRRPIILHFSHENLDRRGLLFKAQGLWEPSDFVKGDPIFVKFDPKTRFYDACIVRGERLFEERYQERLRNRMTKPGRKSAQELAQEINTTRDQIRSQRLRLFGNGVGRPSSQTTVSPLLSDSGSSLTLI